VSDGGRGRGGGRERERERRERENPVTGYLRAGVRQRRRQGQTSKRASERERVRKIDLVLEPLGGTH
jgi:hypothetical protein